MSLLDDLRPLVDEASFSWRDLQDQDVWTSFAPVFPVLTVVGTPTYTGRYRFVGRKCEFQVKAVSSTSIASTAGTSYMSLPAAAQGLAGEGIMQNLTTFIAVGLCVVSVSDSRLYLPALAASGNTFLIAGSYEA